MLQLRSYQQALLRRVQDGLAAGPKARLMIQLPTGGGKTVIAGALLSDWLQNGRKAVWLTHRTELAEQTRRMLTDAGVSAITNVNWTPGEDAPAMAGGAVILMAQTVGRRTARREVWNRYDAGDLLVIDEAHHAAAPGWERAMQQWPGPTVGMTATPWRLSEKEGFGHLFDDLLCGPQTADLQALGKPALCKAQVFIPPAEQRIAGGAVDRTGDYNERGIEQANRDRPDILTAGALAFWQKHAVDSLNNQRQTIAYAVSVDHAHNLAAMFNEAGISAAVILGDTNREERDRAIAGFRDGSIKVLVNVVVATEGFDLPDASCVIIARPTMSLALYLQMVGRGLRPKPDGGDCIILDLATNSATHGLPEDHREWSLEPRGVSGIDVVPIVWCQTEWCDVASPAASHHCRGCGHSFGKECDRCGRWRSYRSRWLYEKYCGDAHQHVCDLCHIDAHIQAHLPVAPPLDALVYIYDTENEMTFTDDIEMGDDLANRLSVMFKELLERERHSVTEADDARREELRGLIEDREAVLNDNARQFELFNEQTAGLPESERPGDPIQQGLMITAFINSLRTDLAGWKAELAELENWPVDKQAIFSSANSKVAHLLRRAAERAELLPDWQGRDESSSVPHSTNQLRTNISASINSHRPTSGNGVALPITLLPSPEAAFKDALMRTKQAWIVTTYRDGREEVSPWRANNITQSSNIVGNIRSRPQFRSGEWQENGIASVKVCIEHPNASPETPPSGSEPRRFQIGPNGDGAFAVCDVYSKDRIVVLAGSTATKRDLNENHRSFINRKNELIADGTLKDEGQLYKFTKDCEFQAATPVAAIVWGNRGAAQGLDVMKDAGGITFRHYFA